MFACDRSARILIADFTSFGAREKMRMALGIACEMRQHMSARPTGKRHIFSALFLGDRVGDFQQLLVRLCAALDVSVQSAAVEFHQLKLRATRNDGNRAVGLVVHVHRHSVELRESFRTQHLLRRAGRDFVTFVHEH